MIKVLLFAASPRGLAPLDLPREFRAINEEVRLGTFRDAVELILVPGARPIDLLRKLNESQPQVVHFSSHGSPDEILLEAEEEGAEAANRRGSSTRSDSERDIKTARPGDTDGPLGQGQPHPVRGSALADVLRSCDEGNLRLVVLNACDTRTQAESLTEVVDCVVSMNRTITDRAAIKFAASFYGALSFGRSVKKAFDQGVALLRAEGIAEAGTPELFARSGVDPSRVVLVGPTNERSVAPAAEGPFFVPFPRNPDFVGRSDDLDSLHASLQKREPVGIRPAGLTGMGGIGKTQLAVEYAHRYRGSYPDGIFWVNAAEPLAMGLAEIGGRLQPDVRGEPLQRRLQAAFEQLSRRTNALLVLDNLLDPAQLARTVGSEGSPLTLACRILFTTRHRELGRFRAVEVSVLPAEPALHLLLRHHSRQRVIEDSAHPERPEAEAICRLLGWLPLALELAGAFLGAWHDISLADYRKRLTKEGCLLTLDNELPNLAEVDLQSIHTAAVAATLSAQWNALNRDDEAARILLRVAGQFAEAAAIPTNTLGLFAGISPAHEPGHPSPLSRALRRLYDVRLLEELVDDRIRLHPLVREFARDLTLEAETPEFRNACARRVVFAFEDLNNLEDTVWNHSVSELEYCLSTALEFASVSDSVVREAITSMLRVFRREAHHLRDLDLRRQSSFFAQQVVFRAVSLGDASLAMRAEHRLAKLAEPCLILRWRIHRESSALLRVLTGHLATVTSVAVSPDGQLILSGSEDRTVVAWNLQTGLPHHLLSGHQGGVTSVAASPNGRHIISGSRDRTVAIWDLCTGQRICSLHGHDQGVTSVAASPDGRLIVSGSWDCSAAVWDNQTGERVRLLTGHRGAVSSVAFSPDGRLALSGSWDHTVAIWDLETGNRIRTLTGHSKAVTDVACSPDGRLVISASEDRTAVVWDLDTGTRLRTLRGHHDGVTSVTVSPDGRRIISGSDDHSANVWDLHTGDLIRSLTGHHDWVTSVSSSPDGHLVVSGSMDHTVAVWDVAAAEGTRSITGHRRGVTGVAVSPDGRLVASGSWDNTVALWDFNTQDCVRWFTDHRDKVGSVAFSPDGRLLVFGSDDNKVGGTQRRAHICDTRTGKCLRSLTGHHGAVSSVAFSPDGRYIASGSHDTIAAVWDVQTGKRVRSLTGHGGAVSSVAFSPDGRLVISGSWDHTLAIWDRITGERIHTLTGHDKAVTSVAFSPDGQLVASASEDRTSTLWNLHTGERIRTLAGHNKAVTSVTFSPDGRSIASGSDDETVAVWDRKTGDRLTSLSLDGPIWCVTWHPEGRFLVAGDMGGNLYGVEYRSM
jgi:WD40 repeat protein